MRTPEQAFYDAIERFEGVPLRNGSKLYWQTLARDVGNWVTDPAGRRIKLGTMYGVTPGALATFLNVPAHTITLDRMKAVTLDEAVQIGLANFYRGPGWDRLPWCPAIEAAVDFGWGSGPARAIAVVQRLAGAVPDGTIGPATVDAVRAWLARGGDAATEALADARVAFYRAIPAHVSNDGKFTAVWIPRANWFRPGNRVWMQHWKPLPGVAGRLETAEWPGTPVDAPPIPSPKPAPPKPEEAARAEAETQKMVQIGAVTGGAATGLAAVFQAIPGWAAGVAVIAIVAIVGFLVVRSLGRVKAAAAPVGAAPPGAA